MKVARHLTILIALLSTPGMTRAADQLSVDDVMTRDPEIIVVDHLWTFEPKLKDLWQLALNRPESELQRLAADTIAMAHRRGMAGLNAVVDDLAKTLQSADTTPSVRRAAAHALIVLDAKQHRAAMAAAAGKYGLDLQTIVEPALANWGDQSLVETWRRRLKDNQTSPRLRMLAINALGTLRDVNCAPSLLEIVSDHSILLSHRLAAAQSLYSIGQGGMLEQAKGLLADKSPKGISDRILAVQLLSAKPDAAALDLLVELSNDPEPAVAGAAIARVFAVEPARVFPLAAQAIKHSDVNIRGVGARALLLRADTAAIETLTPLLDDPNPGLRRAVAKGIFDLSKKPELLPAALIAAETALKSESWRALEQGALLVGHLGHKPTASRLIELLPHRRVEVAVTSAWSLRQFKIPETFSQILTHANLQHERQASNQTLPHEKDVIYAQDSQLFQFFGEVRLEEADPLLRKYVPKAIGMGDARPAACWALGKIHEGKSPDDLISQFATRLADVNSMPAEIDGVRVMCAVGLGRMKGESQIETLRRFCVEGTQPGRACWWAIQQLTGETPPPMVPSSFQVLGWFLQTFEK